MNSKILEAGMGVGANFSTPAGTGTGAKLGVGVGMENVKPTSASPRCHAYLHHSATTSL